MQEQKKQKTAIILPTILIVAILLVVTTLVLKINSPAKEGNNTLSNEEQSSKIAKMTMNKMAASISNDAENRYQQSLERYNKLQPTEKANFDVVTITEQQVIKQLSSMKNKSILSDDFAKIDTLQPSTTTMVLSTDNPKVFTMRVVGKVGAAKTTLKQKISVQFDIATVSTSSKYDSLYAIQATNRIVIQNASNILGMTAAPDTNNMTVDGSSCQHAFSGTSYLNKCVNDGNTAGSDLKIQNALSFEKALPNFPKKEIKALDKSDYNNEKLYYAKKLPKIDPDDDTEKKRVKKYFFLKDGFLTIDSSTKKKFSKTKPFSFTSSEERLKSLTIDAVNSYIDIGDGVQTLRIDELALTNGAKLHIVGDGSLKLFIKTIRSSDGKIISDGAKLATYIDGSDKIKLDKSFKSEGFLYSKKASIEMEANNYAGNILSGGKTVSITGGSSPTKQLLLAPNATIELSNRTNFIGAIIGHSVVITKSTVTFAKPKEAVNFPITYKEYGKVRDLVLFEPIK